MTFLTPIPALIAAAIAAPALLLLYFLKLRRRPVRVSSTLLWLQATRDLQVNIPFRWLRITGLLLLQLLILALFLLAMARPAMDLPGAAASRVIILIDRSASMSATDISGGHTPATRLHEAQARAQRFITELAAGAGSSSIAVVAFAVRPEILFNFSTDRQGARLAIDSIQPTDQPGDLGAAVRLAGAMLAGDTDESGARRTGLVILFSDGGFGDEGYTLAGAEFRYERIGPITDPENIGIVAVAARRDRDDPGSVRVFARILNAAKREVAVPVVLSLNGNEIDRHPLIIPAAAEIPAQAAATFTLRARDGGVCQVRLDHGDSLDSDNIASVVLTPAAKPRLLVVRPDTPGPAPWVITNILDEMELPYRTTSASAYEQDALSPAPPRFDLIIFDGMEPRTLPRGPSLSFGASLPGLAKPEGRPGYFITWRRTHPVLRDVALDSVYVSKAIGLPESGAGLTELARGPGGPLIVELDQGPRFIVAFNPADSTWPLNAGFPIFLAAVIDHLTLRAEENAGRSFTTAEPATLDVTGLNGTVSLDGPAPLNAEVPAGATTVDLGTIERAGLYRGPGGKPVLAVNLLNETESSLAVAQSLRVGGETVASQSGTAGPREFWPWLILAALILLSIEWFLNAWLMRA